MAAALAVVVSLRLFNISAATPALIEEAQRAFSQIYAVIGVGVEWSADPSALLIIIRDDEPADLRRAARPVLGVAIHAAERPSVAYVFYRRAISQGDLHGVSPAIVLASAMAHEVGHILLPAGAHGRDGLMRECWDHSDFVRAAAGQLRFSPGEGSSIRASTLVRPVRGERAEMK
jgi:hypothetical protein